MNHPCQGCEKLPTIEAKLHDHSVLLTGNGKGVKESVAFRLSSVEEKVAQVYRVAWFIATGVGLLLIKDLWEVTRGVRPVVGAIVGLVGGQ